MLRFTASKLLIRNLNLLKGAFYRLQGGGFCVFQSYKSMEKDLGMRTEEIGTLAYYCKIAVIL